ncbi:MAG TPA: glycosyltransferase [Trueperaceae bacterium]
MGLAGVGPTEADRRRAPPTAALRIAFFVDVFPRISNTFILNQINGLLDRGHQLDIFARSLKPFERNHGELYRYDLEARLKHFVIPGSWARRVSLAAGQLLRPYAWRPAVLDALDFRRHGSKALNLSQLYTTLSFLRHSDYDVVHAQFGKLGPALLPLKRSGALRAPLVVSFRGADLSSALEKNPRIYDELFGAAELLLPVSEYFRQKLIAAGAPAERTCVLHSGIETERFPFAVRSRAPEEETRVLFIGRLTEKKGLTDAIEAVARTIASGRRIRLTVVGEGELEESARRQAEEAGIAPQVTWLGAQNSAGVVAQLARAHLLVAPSVTASDGDQEGIPNVVKEAMASGLPVLSTRHSGIPELVEDGVSGFLVEERSPEQLHRRLRELVDRPELWPSMGRAGRAKVVAEYDSAKLNDRLVELYRSLR